MISAVFVSYRSPALAVRAAASFRREAGRAGLRGEAIVVVNSCDPEEAAALEGAFDRVLYPGRNLGYAGGLNAGAAAARGEVLVFANPDLEFLQDSVGALARAVSEGGLAVVGPALFWDDAATLLLPPAEEPRPAELVRRALALDPARSAPLFRREARRALAREAVIRAGRTAEVSAVSGALMATTRRTYEAVGSLDERYRLYYEENDWQLRLRTAGGRVLVCGEARVVHRYAQSARREAQSESWFRESEKRYFESHFGEAGRRALSRARVAPAQPPELPASEVLSWEPGREVLVAVSPVPSFRPFVISRPPPGVTSFRLPADVLSGHGDVPWYARAFDGLTFEVVGEARLVSASDSGRPGEAGQR